MNIKIVPKKLKGIIDVMPSKSHAHRILIALKLAQLQRDGLYGRPSGLSSDREFGQESAHEFRQEAGGFYIPDFSQDITATKNCLAQLDKDVPFLDCGESGSTFRFMLPVAMALKEKAVFMGSGKLPYRPIEPLKKVMEAAGCSFIMNDPRKNTGVKYKEICTVIGSLKPGSYAIAGNESSQYITGLLFALPLLNGDSTLTLTTPLESEGYVSMALEVLENFGISIERSLTEDGLNIYGISGNQIYTEPENLTLQGDWSNAAFWLVCGALGGEITCRGLDLSSAQGDKEIVNILKSMGAIIESSPIASGKNQVFLSCHMAAESRLKGTDVDISQTPDLAPVLAVAMSAAEGSSLIANAERLRIKESDRIKAIFDFLNALGADISFGGSSISLTGTPCLKGGQVDSQNDHRIAMAAAVAACCCREPVIIRDAQAVNKSYPDFFKDYVALGGEIYEV